VTEGAALSPLVGAEKALTAVPAGEVTPAAAPVSTAPAAPAATPAAPPAATTDLGMTGTQITPEQAMANITGPQASGTVPTGTYSVQPGAPNVQFGFATKNPFGSTPVPNMSTPTGPAYSPPPSAGPTISAVPEGLLKRINTFLEDVKKSEGYQLYQNLQELRGIAKAGEQQQPGAQENYIPQEQPIEPTIPTSIPELTRAETTNFASDLGLGTQGLGFSNERARAIQDLISELRLNRRSFG